MAEPRIAKALDVLRKEVDAASPDRNKSMDGWIGDEAHRNRVSDHNPDPTDDVVKALDITHDPAHGIDAGAIAEQVLKDERTKYVIWNGRIASGSGQDHPQGVWRNRNKGPNDHTKHVHVSVKPEPTFFDSDKPWGIAASEPHGSIITRRRLKKGDKGEDVKELQHSLGLDADGIFGDETEAAVRAFQSEHDLEVDGIAGPYTWDELLPAVPAGPTKINVNIKATVFNDVELAYGPVAPNTVGVSLPAPLPRGTRIWLRNRANGLTTIAENIDKGPWNTDDPYWEAGKRPQAESGTDRKGRKTNKAGIDLYPETARRLGIPFIIRDGKVIAGEGYIDWAFASDLPIEIPELPDEMDVRLEDLWKQIKPVIRTWHEG